MARLVRDDKKGYGNSDNPLYNCGLMMPWDKRTETQTAKRRRQNREMKRERDEQQCFEREKFNSIDQYLLSGDEQVIICSYFAHHLNIFSVVSEEHLHTLEDRWAPLSLRTAALTHTVVYLILSNYNEAQHVLYLTLWDTQKGRVRKRLKNLLGICCIAISEDACRVVFGIAGFNKYVTVQLQWSRPANSAFILKGLVTLMKICHCLLTLMSIQTLITYALILIYAYIHKHFWCAPRYV
ncbi:uncharacterized protein LOC127414360 isoform X2 [Myxocyprinus asiaticus]|uniref:uncharacterized protein LOC127414360 isoform X2 n=1 Tax=Myxocyprinus asiaticus TaxID=70543 RepID=UPI00222243BF|nr:uncharacterized protein LOC127414360 isoform X2 [Myxocyprinus asiaticus]XP_051508320.1 uncharacterized protein LOC127414360 isoform X2 [Myxocyprinus asiaticus]XP_051508330.1 uncharacterized protein LOC127414360 isoform X2 [Myxocyprinus asiaticus]